MGNAQQRDQQAEQFVHQLQVPHPGPEGGHAGPVGRPIRRPGQTGQLRRSGHPQGGVLLGRGAGGPARQAAGKPDGQQWYVFLRTVFSNPLNNNDENPM